MASPQALAKLDAPAHIEHMASKSRSSGSKYAGRSAATGRYVLKPATTSKRSYRDSKTGLFVTEKTARKHPSTVKKERLDGEWVKKK